MTTVTFAQRTQDLFARRLGLTRKWKTACAMALHISRATFYRYLAQDEAVPEDIWIQLARLESSNVNAAVRDDREMVSLYAAALVSTQDALDEAGWLKPPYPDALQRVLSLGAARNLADTSQPWPVDLPALLRAARRPLAEWVPDMGWDPEALFFDAFLVRDGELTPECRTLAAKGRDPETELDENKGYRLLRSLCMDRPDGEDVYRAWRRLIIRHPLLPARRSQLLMQEPVLENVERWPELLDAFYAPLPEAAAMHGQVPICTVSGTVLRMDERGGFLTECRLPEAVRRARRGEHELQPYMVGMGYLRRAFRTYWCLPGLIELDLAERLERAGWHSVLWPKLDTVDLIAKAPDDHRRIAVDVKDYLSPSNLATRFNGFKQYAGTHECFLVVPDYVTEGTPRFAERFKALRAALGKTSVKLRTVNGLLGELRELF